MELTLQDYIAVILKRRAMLVAVVAGCLLAAAVLTLRATPVYEAQAKLFVGQQQVTLGQLSEGQSVVDLSGKLLHSYTEIIRTRPIAQRAIDEDDELTGDPGDIARRVRADAVLGTQIIRLSYRDPDPRVATLAVNAIGRAFVEQIQEIELPVGPGVDTPAIRVSVVEPALLPNSPVSPDPARNMLLAGILGLMLGLGMVFLLESLDTRVKSKADAEATAESPVLATIASARKDMTPVPGPKEDPAVMEGYRKLRGAIQFVAVDADIRAILITSPNAGDGKTSVSANLAIAYAQANVSTLLVDADLRNPKVHELFSIRRHAGLTHVLTESAQLQEAAIRNENLPTLSILNAGAIPPNPSELLGSQRMANLIKEAERAYEIVIIDSAPILPVSDTLGIASRVEGTLMVVRAKRTRRNHLQEAKSTIVGSGGRVLGIALLGRTDDQTSPSYYYGDRYGYGRYQRRPATATEPDRSLTPHAQPGQQQRDA